jgi:hypothetical protein
MFSFTHLGVIDYFDKFQYINSITTKIRTQEKRFPLRMLWQMSYTGNGSIGRKKLSADIARPLRNPNAQLPKMFEMAFNQLRIKNRSTCKIMQILRRKKKRATKSPFKGLLVTLHVRMTFALPGTP